MAKMLDPTVLAMAGEEADAQTKEDFRATLKAQRELAEFQLLEAKRLAGDRIALETQSKKAREANIQSVKEGLAAEKAKREACPHRKPPPSGATALAGQRDHSGHLHLICQYCQASFVDGEVPPHLRVDPGMVGGPIL